jgi:hypothetical protein
VGGGEGITQLSGFFAQSHSCCAKKKIQDTQSFWQGAEQTDDISSQSSGSHRTLTELSAILDEFFGRKSAEQGETDQPATHQADIFKPMK